MLAHDECVMFYVIDEEAFWKQLPSNGDTVCLFWCNCVQDGLGGDLSLSVLYDGVILLCVMKW